MILPSTHRWENAIRFKNSVSGNLWLALGGTSAWPNESIPPAESKSATGVAEKFCAIKATVKWVKEDPDSGTIIFKDAQGNTRKFLELATEDDVRTNQSGLVLMQAEATGAEIGQNFRIMGFYSGLVPATGFEAETFLTSGQVDDWGKLESLQNRTEYAITVGAITYVLQHFIQH